MEIVPATVDDLEGFVPLFDLYRQFYKLPEDKASAKNFLQERLLKHDSVIFLAKEENEVLAFVQLYPSFSSLAMKPSWILNDLFVDPRHRKKKIATLLIEKCEEFGKESGARGLTLMTGIDNEAAQNLYRSLGWKEVTQYKTFSRSFS